MIVVIRQKISPSPSRFVTSYSMTRTGIPDGSSIFADPRCRWVARRPRTFGSSRNDSYDPSGKSPHNGQVRAVLHPPQQISPGAGRRLPQLVAVEPAVGDDKHAWLEISKELAGQSTLADPPRCQPRGYDGMRSAFPQAYQAHLREWSGILLTSRPAEGRSILRCIGNVQHEPVNGHQPAGAKPGAPGAALRAGNRDPLE